MVTVNEKDLKPYTNYIAVWEHNGQLWSDTVQIDENGVLLVYVHATDGFTEIFIYPDSNVKYYSKMTGF